MNLLSQYVLRVGAYIIFSLLLEGITPNGASKKIVKLMISLVFMYILIQPVYEWIDQKVPLTQLTTEDFSWNERTQTVDYEKQAWEMVGKGYEQVLAEQGLPQELQEKYSMQEIKVTDVVEVTLVRKDQVGSLTDRSLQFGQIGIDNDEKENVINELSQYWGIRADQVEMKLR